MRTPALGATSSRHHERPLDGFGIVLCVAAGTLLALVLIPIAWMLLGTQPAAVQGALFDNAVVSALGTTFAAGAWATVLALLTGVPLAYLLARYRIPGKPWIMGLVRLPVVIPHTAAGIALLMVLGRRGLLGRWLGPLGLRFTDSLPGIVVAMLFVGAPFLVSAAREAFEGIDPELEAMAEVSGASPWQAFRYVTLPLALPGILSGALVMWGRGISEFGAVAILAYNPKIVPVLVFERFEGSGLDAAQPIAAILIVASLGVFVVAQLLLRHGDR